MCPRCPFRRRLPALTPFPHSYGPPHSKRVMDLPNTGPDPQFPVDAYVAPSFYAASHPSVQALASAHGRPIAVVHPAALRVAAYDAPLAARDPAAKRIVGFLGRLSTERSPGLFLRAAALVQSLPALQHVRASSLPSTTPRLTPPPSSTSPSWSPATDRSARRSSGRPRSSECA